MKKNKTILLIILVALMAIYAFLALRKPQEREETLIKLNSQAIDKIEIWDAFDSILLSKTQDGWKLGEDMVWDADSLVVHGFFMDVIDARYARSPVSTGADGLSRYELNNEKALHIKISAGDKNEYLLFSNLGKAWDYFRFADANEVYQVKSKVVSNYLPEMSRWRDPLIIHILEEEIERIEVNHLRNSYSLIQDYSGWKYKDSRQEFDIFLNNFSLVKVISILQNFQSYLLDTDMSEELVSRFKEPIATVLIKTTDGKSTKLTFARLDENQSMMILDDDLGVIHHVSHETINRFTRAPEAFQEAPGF